MHDALSMKQAVICWQVGRWANSSRISATVIECAAAAVHAVVVVVVVVLQRTRHWNFGWTPQLFAVASHSPIQSQSANPTAHSNNMYNIMIQYTSSGMHAGM